MVDAEFGDPRLAELYDHLEGDRPDLDVYARLVEEVGARSILDIGCGTGTLACQLAADGKEVVGLDPAEASIDIARCKPFADRVEWIVGDVGALPPIEVDLVIMTGNVAQVFTTDEAWTSVLEAAHHRLLPRGRLVFESRDPDARGWEQWTRDQSRRVVDV